MVMHKCRIQIHTAPLLCNILDKHYLNCNHFSENLQLEKLNEHIYDRNFETINTSSKHIEVKNAGNNVNMIRQFYSSFTLCSTLKEL